MSLVGALAIGAGVSYILDYMMKARYNNNLQTLLAENGYKVKRDGLCQFKREITGLSIKDLVPIYNLGAASNKGALLAAKAKVDKNTGKSELLEKLKEEGLVEELSEDEKTLIDHNKAFGVSNRATVRWWRLREMFGHDRLSDKAKAKAAKLVASKSSTVKEGAKKAPDTKATVTRPTTTAKPAVTRPIVGKPSTYPPRPSVIRPGTTVTPRTPDRRSVLKPTEDAERRAQIKKVNDEIERLKRYKASLEAISRADDDTLRMLDEYGLGLDSRSKESTTGRRM